MLFGCCAGMLGGGKSCVGMENIPIIKKLGFDYIEFALSGIAGLEESVFEQVLCALQDNDFACRSCNGFLPGNIQLTGNSVDKTAALNYVENALTRAEKMGVQYVVFGSSGSRNAPRGFSKVQALAQMRDCLNAFGDIAGKHGVTLVIEPLNLLESNIVNHYLQGLVLIEQVHHPHVAALADYFHMRMNGESMEDLLYSGGHLKHLHIASTLGRTLPLPGDGDHYAQLFDALKEIGYDGGISIEGGMRPGFGEKELTESLAYLRSFDQ